VTTARPFAVLDFCLAPGLEKRWFNSTPALNVDFTARFRSMWEAGRHGALQYWEAGCALALVILLDQFPLNITRHRPEFDARSASSYDDYFAPRLMDAQREPRRAARHKTPSEIDVLAIQCGPEAGASDITGNKTGSSLPSEKRRVIGNASPVWVGSFGCINIRCSPPGVN